MRYILFICIANAGRSQMAQALFNYKKRQQHPLIDREYTATSAGIKPVDRVGPITSRVLMEMGIDISDQRIYHPKGVTEEMIREARVVICLDRTIKDSDLFGYSLSERWDIQDTYRQTEETIKQIRDEISRKIDDFIAQLYQIG